MTDKHLVLVDKIETRLRKPRSEVVFPLAANHRKELRHLRDSNVGELKTQIRFIKNEKLNDYKEKYKNSILKDAKRIENDCEALNKDWEQRLKKINSLIEERKKIEEKAPLKATKNSSYEVNRLFKPQWENNYNIQYNFDPVTIVNEVAEKEFEEQYGEAFSQLNERITKIQTAYEEAINFGDLEVVKELYYKMKDADQFLDKIRNLKV